MTTAEEPTPPDEQEAPGQVPPQEPADPAENDPQEGDDQPDDYDADQDEPGDKTDDAEAIGLQQQDDIDNPDIGHGTPEVAPELLADAPPPDEPEGSHDD